MIAMQMAVGALTNTDTGCSFKPCQRTCSSKERGLSGKVFIWPFFFMWPHSWLKPMAQGLRQRDVITHNPFTFATTFTHMHPPAQGG